MNQSRAAAVGYITTMDAHNTSGESGSDSLDTQIGEVELSEHRNRAYRALATTALVVLLPLAANDFIQGRMLSGVVNACVVLVLAVNVISTRRGGPSTLPFVVTLLPIFVAVPLAILVQGFTGVIWSYPVVVFLYSAPGRRQARIYSTLFTMAVVPVVFITLGLRASIGVAITLVVVAVFGSIFTTFVERLHRELQQLVVTDPLTGAHNRRHLDRSLRQTMDRHRRYGAVASLIAVDIDRFKRVNDEFGHDVGDAALRDVVRAIRSRMRRGDDIFRTGGDEFMVLLPDTRLEDATEIAETLRLLVSESEIVKGQTTTISCGVGDLTAIADQQLWLKACDEALYRAKQLGRDRVVTVGPPEVVDSSVT
jgi:diguanylate cyclase (GGDEF)-like protein